MLSIGSKIRFRNEETGNIYTGIVIYNENNSYYVDVITGGKFHVNLSNVVSEDEWNDFVRKHSIKH